MPIPLDSQIVLLAAVGLLAALIGFGLGRWGARRRLRGAVDEWQQRLTQSEAARQQADEEVQRLATQVADLNVAAEQARDRTSDSEAEAQRAARELADQRQHVAGMEEELETLKAQEVELREEIETWRDEVAHLQREQLTAEENLDRLASDLTTSRDRGVELEGELASAQDAERRTADALAESSEELASMQDEVARLRRVKLEFQEWMQGAAAREEELGHARRQLADATREQDTLRDEIERRDQRVAELEREVESNRLLEESPPPRPRPVGEPPELLAEPDGAADDLKRIRGIGPVLERTLNQLGVYHYRQIADWTEAEIEWIASHIHTFPARILRDRWTEQAAELGAPNRRSGF